MINTENYQTKEFSPVLSVHATSPKKRLRVPRKSKCEESPAHVEIHPRDLNFLSDFVKVSAFYIEDLEDYVGEELMDF